MSYLLLSSTELNKKKKNAYWILPTKLPSCDLVSHPAIRVRSSEDHPSYKLCSGSEFLCLLPLFFLDDFEIRGL